MRGLPGQGEDAGQGIERCSNSRWQRAVDRQHVAEIRLPDVDLRTEDHGAVEVAYVDVAVSNLYGRPARGDECPIVAAPGRRIVGIEIDVRPLYDLNTVASELVAGSSWPSC